MVEEITTNSDIGEVVREIEQNWISGKIQVSKYVTENFYEDIQTIEAYLNSKHISGQTDSLGREKPSFNIVLAKKNITARATDLDRKNVRAKAKKAKDYLAQFIYSIHIQEWMDKAKFGLFLNEWGDYLASFNSAIVKFVENSEGLSASVMDWNKIMCDVIDFDSNPKVEILELTPAQLKKRNGYDKEMVDKLIRAQTSREMPDKQKKDLKNNYIKLYEVHGELPLSYLTGKEKDQDSYVQQMHVISFVAKKEEGKYDDYCLIKGREKKDPYLLTWLIPSVDGSISLMGSVKSLFEAQWMTNHSMKAIKDQLDLASKIITQTSDANFENKNILNNIEQGQILIHKVNEPLTTVPNNSHDITSLIAFKQQWQDLAQELASTPDILSGTNMPSGTAFRQAAIVQQEAHSNFDLMIESKGLFIEIMFREFITDYLLKKMDTTEEISATLSDYGIDKIDEKYVANEAVKRFNYNAVEAVINKTQLPDLGQEQQQVRQEFSTMGGQRFIKPSGIPNKTWKDIIGKFEGSVIYEITDENIDKKAVVDTLMNMLQTLANPNYQAFLQTEQGKYLLDKTIEEVGKFSPLELPKNTTPTMPNSIMVGAGTNNQPINVK